MGRVRIALDAPRASRASGQSKEVDDADQVSYGV
jgi:hypothetical protein